MRFEFSFSQGFRHFKPYQDKYWADPGIAMSMYQDRTFIGAAGVTIISTPKIMVVDPINILPQYRGTFLFYAMVRRLSAIAADLEIKKFVLLCMYAHPEQLKFAKKLGCKPYDSDPQGVYCIGDLPLKILRRRTDEKENS